MKRPSHIEHTFKTKDDFFDYLRQRHKNLDFAGSNVLDLKNLKFEYDLMLPVNLPYPQNNGQLHSFLLSCEYIFSSCEFLSNLTIRQTKRQIEFNNQCYFGGLVRITNRDKNITFLDCDINDLDVSNTVLNCKIRIHNCDIYVANFRNTKFNELTDFWSSTFFNVINFYKTDFNATTVFSGVTFNKNVLFTYSLFGDIIIFRGTRFKKGLDLSLAIIKGKLSVFDIPVRWWWWQFRSKKGVLTEKEYDECVKGQIIPVKNKRETYRILKKHYEDVNNISDSVSLAVMEKKTLFTEILFNLFSTNKNQIPLIWFIWGKLLDIFNLIILSLNGLSNWFKSSYVCGIIFTALVGALFFNLSINCTAYENYAFNFNGEVLSNGFKNYMKFLNPTHKFDYLGEHIISDSSTKNGFYVYDYLGRIFVGYGIYQTIQAFRKYR
ncbi:pentapeptide repeat-containing protein [Winogradskyella sp.]|uniref:pentapeptide repeat-containing protein n=1 Tax=Winogradskyella sp. TaxID=1883156 RepID=UPI001B20701F|nr:pentapeptide repeat-containing protein [Winogradskyella sp.]MBO6880902.1 pentapeptide repeat-containing protein [Winogradskyella sp.]